MTTPALFYTRLTDYDFVLKDTSINCRERLEYKADGAQKPECTQST